MKKSEKYLEACRVLAPIFSTCGRSQFVALIVSVQGSVVGWGYNGAPAGMKHCVDGGCPRLNSDATPNSNYDSCVAIHAEENAIIRSDPTARLGGTLYVNGVPCYGCAKIIANSGLERVVIPKEDARVSIEAYNKVDEFLFMAGIQLERK